MNRLPLALLLCLLGTAAGAAEAGLEYRLRAKVGVAFTWRDGKAELLEPLPFMTRADVRKATAVRARNPNAPGAYAVTLTHNARGRARFRAAARADREREFCIVFRASVLQCAAFPPRVKGLRERASAIYGPFAKGEAEMLAREINRSLR